MPDCKAIYLIQSVRIVAISGTDSVCVPVEQVGYPFAPSGIDSLKSTLTPAPGCTFIDHLPGEFDPYMNGLDKTDVGQAGRSGSNPAQSTTGDAPYLSVPSGTDAILA